MPIYEYTCQACGSDFELLVMSAATKPVCPGCGSAKLDKKFSTFAAHQASAANACADVGCPGASHGKSPCSGGKCPFSG